MTRPIDILRADLDGLAAENLLIKAEISELRAEVTALKSGLDDRIQATVLRAWGEMLKAQPPRESQEGD